MKISTTYYIIFQNLPCTRDTCMLAYSHLFVIVCSVVVVANS